MSDLLHYQTLIIETHLEYQGDTWMGYDHRFCRELQPPLAYPGQTKILPYGIWHLQQKPELLAANIVLAYLMLLISATGLPTLYPNLCWMSPLPKYGQQKTTFICGT